MSKKVERVPVPEDHIERFWSIILSMVEPFGVDKVPGVFRQVEALGQSVERYQVEKRFNVSPKKRIHADRKQFIAIFKSRYLQLTDFEYSRAITGIDGRMIGQVCKELQKREIEIAFYLKWLFEEFLVDNEKFCPPTFKFACSALAWEKFLFTNRERLKSQKQEDKATKEALEYIQRARVLIRNATDSGERKKITETIKAFGDGRIMIAELRKFVERREVAAEQQ
jgi:hypothetical protein